ncbi:MAG TPA: GNAT family N-acetyltransferase [Vicinamibacterales bacterium]
MIDLALERVPDDPWRVDTRGMLLSGRAEVAFADQPEAAADGFVVSIPDAALVSIVGQPPRALILNVVRALDGLVNVLCQPADARHTARALAGWQRTIAILHTLPDRPLWEEAADGDARIFTARDAPNLGHVPQPLRDELTNALRGRPTARFVASALPDRDVPPPLEPTPIAGVWAGRRPVSFCYPALRTEQWWDIATETLPDHRRCGYAGRAVRAMTRHMWQTGRAPVWGATVDNAASLAAARSLGFQEVGRVIVFSGEAE